MLKQSTENPESPHSASLTKKIRGIICNRVLQLLAVLALIAPACKDGKITDIRENLKRLSKLCANEKPTGYCNDDKPKSRIKFAIEDGTIVYDSKKGNFVYEDGGETVAENRSDEETMEETMEEARIKEVKAQERKDREDSIKKSEDALKDLTGDEEAPEEKKPTPQPKEEPKSKSGGHGDDFDKL